MDLLGYLLFTLTKALACQNAASSGRAKITQKMERDLEGSRRARLETHPDHLPGRAEKNHLNLTKDSQ
jgi:hypothetical protein